MTDDEWEDPPLVDDHERHWTLPFLPPIAAIGCILLAMMLLDIGEYQWMWATLALTIPLAMIHAWTHLQTVRARTIDDD